MISKAIKFLFVFLFCFGSTGTLLAVPISGQGTWQSTLQPRDLDGNGVTDAFYDTTLNITWLANADLLRGYGWGSAMSFAADFAIGVYSDWRLPNVIDTGTPLCNTSYSGTDCGLNVQTKTGDIVYSEMAHLWYVTLGNWAEYLPSCASMVLGDCVQQFGHGLSNTGNFQGLGLSEYWSSTRNPPAGGGNEAFIFGMSNGFQSMAWMDLGRSSMFVRDGDVNAIVPVAFIPEPGTLLLLGIGIVGVAASRRGAKVRQV
jgi:hypothetical protein